MPSPLAPAAAVLLLPCLLAQEPAPPPAPPPAALPAPSDPAAERATADLRHAVAQLQARPFAFTGVCRLTGASRLRQRGEPIEFRGACRDGLVLVQCRDVSSLHHGMRQLVRREGGTWTRPQGDEPEPAPSALDLAAIANAIPVQIAEPAFPDGRPVVRAHSTCQGEAAARLMADLAYPDKEVQMLLEQLPRLVGPELVQIDAVFESDPSTRTLRSITLRACVFTPDAAHAADADEDPSGLAPVARQTVVQVVWQVHIEPADAVPFPELDAAMRERLGWAPPVPPLPAAPPVVK